jgi:hypothetical protein
MPWRHLTLRVFLYVHSMTSMMARPKRITNDDLFCHFSIALKNVVEASKNIKNILYKAFYSRNYSSSEVKWCVGDSHST